MVLDILDTVLDIEKGCGQLLDKYKLLWTTLLDNRGHRIVNTGHRHYTKDNANPTI
jgi:hypothetical protein